jgi:hypothetical protein
VSKFDDQDAPVDVATVAADDLLLDALGSGADAPADDELGKMLAAWRSDLDEDVPPASGRTVALAPVVPLRPRWRRVAAGVAAAVILFGGGIVVGAANAGPDSPLWPITRTVYRDHARSAEAEHAVANARRAAEDGRYDDARRLVDVASKLIDQVTDQKRAAELRAELDAVRRMLPESLSSTSTPTPGVSAPPGSEGPGGAGPGGGATPGGGGATGGVPGAPGVPGLPTPTLPGLPLPTPTLPVPVPTPPTPTLPVPLPSITL